MRAPDPPSEEAVALFKQGNAHKDAGEPQAALKSYNQALALNPHYAHALCNRGVVLAALRRLDEALESYDRALAIDPIDAITHYNRGVLLHEQKDWNGALESYRRAIESDPGRFHAHFNSGLAHRELQEWEAALASFDRAIAIDARIAAPHFNRAVMLQQVAQPAAALQSYLKAIELDPGLFLAHFKCGGIYSELKSPDSALASYDRAVAIKKDYPEAWVNRGTILHEMWRLPEALASFDQAISLRSDYAEAWYSRATTLSRSGQVDAAIASFDRAIALKPDFPEAQYNRSLALLQAGDYAAGWPAYEWRWKNAAKLFMGDPRVFDEPLWLGREDLHGKRILIYCEQGLGDTLQYCRFVRLVANLGAEIIFEVQKPLVNLLAQLPGVRHIVAAGGPLPPFDYQCPLLSLPLAFKITLQSVPAQIPYIHAPADQIALWQARLGGKTRPRIGLVCTGSTAYGNDQNRSIPLAEWVSWLPREYEYVCLQKEYRDADLATLAANPWIADYAAEQKDFSDAAALVENMDLVLSVDTAVAHLAGALGKRTWRILPVSSDWRWMLHREDSPWYPTMRLYRQQTTGEWGALFERVASDLRREFS